VAKIDNDEQITCDEDLAELDRIAETSIPNRNEVVTLKDNTGSRPTVSVCRDQVFKYASVMSSNNLIADLLGIDVNTLVKNFKRELKIGRAFARQKLMVRFYNLAVYGTNPADRIFALKNWTAMSDQGLKEDLEDVEQGAEFKIRRPQKAIERLNDQEIRNDIADEFIARKAAAEVKSIVEQNESD
jgi:hypothetical protein